MRVRSTSRETMYLVGSACPEWWHDMTGVGRAHGGNTGGARPGSGSKTQEVREIQAGFRQVMLATVTPEDIVAIARAMIKKATAGDEKAFRAFMSYVLGSPESQLLISGDPVAPLRVEVIYVDETPEE